MPVIYLLSNEQEVEERFYFPLLLKGKNRTNQRLQQTML